MGLDALLERLAGKSAAVTPVTLVLAADVTAKPALLLACTPVTPVTPPASVTERATRAHRWLLHFLDAEPLTVTFDPATTHADAPARYPGALAAEPISEGQPGVLPEDVAKLIDECVAADLHGAEERPVLAAMHAADAEATRRLVAEMHARIGRCYGCQHFARPGLSDGYCGGRSDLEPAYGRRHPLRLLPADGGANCTAWVER